jgi:serine/threonine protein kinase
VPIPESILNHLANQILRAIDYIHEQGMTHTIISASLFFFIGKGAQNYQLITIIF